jgi:hypothetical protein
MVRDILQLEKTHSGAALLSGQTVGRIILAVVPPMVNQQQQRNHK